MEHLTLETFKQKIFNFELNEDWKYEGSIPCIIKFSASWCGPCRQMAPILESLSEEYKDRINVFDIDVDEEHELSSLFGIRSIPTMMFCKPNVKPETSVGSMSRKNLIDIINNLLE